MPVIRENVAPGTCLATDTAGAYCGLMEFVHETIDHAESCVKGRCHTNGLENFWSLLKRSINGTYVAVDVPHRCRYVDEQVLRFNERKTDDAGRFAAVMPYVVGRRITYKQLIGADAEGHLSSDVAGGA